MSELYHNQYRTASIRLQNWNYGWNASYFVTICTKDRTCFFGDISEGQLKLSNIGFIANVLLYDIKNHAKNIELGEFIVMPNHVHAIINLNADVANADVGTRHALSLHPQPPPPSKTIGQQRFQNQGKNTLSSIVGGFKSAVTKHCNRLGFDFAWQPRFYEHIIRDEPSYQRISHYIQNNPLKWPEDRFKN